MKTTYVKKLFLIDAFGAILSAFLLGIVLVRFESLFGIPKNVLYFLAILPCFFAAYDILCYLKVDKSVGLFLKIIEYTNIIYCIISIGLTFYHFEHLTNLGWFYVLIEIIIVMTLAIIEIKAATKENTHSVS